MLSVVDCIFIGSGFMMCSIIVMAILLLRSFRRVPSQQIVVRSEPPIQEQSYAATNAWDSSMQYEGFTGIVHVHGVKNGDTFRAVITDTNSKCKMEKLVRVRV